MRLKAYENDGQETVVIHLGDHDPSGIDMSRDIRDRLRLFGAKTQLRRIALNMDQVEQYDPPPNPAKLTDSRAEGYIEEYGDDSWELDALDPATLDTLVNEEILAWRNNRTWNISTRAQESQRTRLTGVHEFWDDVVALIDSMPRDRGDSSEDPE
jgi:hypothetical protein